MAFSARKSSGDMLRGGVFRSLLLFSLPLVVGNFFQQLYVTVDAVIVGRYLGSLHLAAVSVAQPMLFVVLFLLAGGCTGITVMAAQLFGAGDMAKLRQSLFSALCFGGAVTAALTVLSLAAAPAVLELTRVPPELRGETLQYLRIVLSGLIFSFFFNYAVSVLRGIGNSKAPFYIQLAASVFHIAVNVLMVGFLDLGVRGSALATAGSYLFSSALCLVYIRRRVPLLALKREDCRVRLWAVSMTFRYSWAAALQSIVVYIGRFLTQGCVNPLGAEVVAGYNAAVRVENVLMIPYDSIGNAEATFIAQNMGAGQYGRVRQGLRTGAVSAFAVMAVLVPVVWLLSPSIMGLFLSHASPDSLLIATGTTYLRIQVFYLLISCLDSAMQYYFRGLARFRLVMTMSMVQIVLRVALTFLLTPRWGIPAIAHATLAGWLAIFFPLLYLTRKSLASLPR